MQNSIEPTMYILETVLSGYFMGANDQWRFSKFPFWMIYRFQMSPVHPALQNLSFVLKSTEIQIVKDYCLV